MAGSWTRAENTQKSLEPPTVPESKETMIIIILMIEAWNNKEGKGFQLLKLEQFEKINKQVSTQKLCWIIT
jgi:hypothetical protein